MKSKGFTRHSVKNSAVKSLYKLRFVTPLDLKYANIVAQNALLKKCTDEKFHLFAWA